MAELSKIVSHIIGLAGVAVGRFPELERNTGDGAFGFDEVMAQYLLPLGVPVLVVDPGVDTGMPILYENPAEVGADPETPIEETLEILTWSQLGIHAKPSGILNVAGYFDDLSRFLDHAVKEGFLTEPHRDAIVLESDPARLLERLRAYSPPEGEKLMGRTNR